jgi:hypothetical protein
MFYLVLRDQNSQAATFFNEEGAEKKEGLWKVDNTVKS